jgi:hypothetical protein
MIDERVIGLYLSRSKGLKVIHVALMHAQYPKSERKLVLVFHQNGRSTVSARLIAPDSRFVDTVGELKSAEMCVSHMPSWKTKKPGKLTQEKVLLELCSRFANSIFVGFGPISVDQLASIPADLEHPIAR